MSAALLRAATALAVAEMALNRSDPVAGALLAQAARATEDLPGERDAARAADLARALDLTASDPAARAARKVAQALCRIAVQDVQAALLGGSQVSGESTPRSP